MNKDGRSSQGQMSVIKVVYKPTGTRNADKPRRRCVTERASFPRDHEMKERQ